jgi:hypothetical protein
MAERRTPGTLTHPSIVYHSRRAVQLTVVQKQVGLFNLIQAESGFEAAAMAVLTRYEGWSKEEAAVLVANARRDARDRSIHSLFHL